MPLEKASELHLITLAGFKMESINEEYLEGPSPEFAMQGHMTYWQASGKYFMYFCQRFNKWRIAEISAFGRNMEGQCFAFVSDGHAGRDILDPSLIKGWIEVEDGQWVQREDAGVAAVGKLGAQMALDQSEEEEGAEAAEAGDANCDAEAEGAESDGSPFKTKKSNCPVMPVVRKATEKAVQATKAASKWVRRLFPNLLGAPDDEDAIPEDEDNSLFPEASPEDHSCDPETQNGCTFKEKYYIEKQRGKTAEQRRGELQRLSNLKGVVMKPDQQKWLQMRVDILAKMVRKDEL